MKIYDISQGIFDAKVYPGDPITEKGLEPNRRRGVFSCSAAD